ALGDSGRQAIVATLVSVMVLLAILRDPRRRAVAFHSAGRDWHETARDEIFHSIMNGVVDRRGRNITELVFRFCIAGKMWTARHLHGFERYERNPVRRKPGGSFAGASGEKAEPMRCIKTRRAITCVGLDTF